MSHLPSETDLYSDSVNIDELDEQNRVKVPKYARLRNGDIISLAGPKPMYIDPSLEQPVMSMISRLNQRLYDYFGVVLPYGYLTIKKARMPEKFIGYEKDGKMRWKKVLGAYKPETFEIHINENIDEGEVGNVLGHELSHYAQHLLGGLREFMKHGNDGLNYIERAADFLNSLWLCGDETPSRKKVTYALSGAGY